jgi:hypothetical protein
MQPYRTAYLKPFTIALWLALSAVTTSGCSFNRATVPGANIPFARADYKLAGATAERVCALYIVGLNFPSLFSDQTASSGGGAGLLAALLGGGGTREEKAALFNALAKMPGATHLLKAQVRNTFSGFGNVSWPLFGQRCAEVKAHAVHMGQPFDMRASRGGVGQKERKWPFNKFKLKEPPAGTKIEVKQ